MITWHSGSTFLVSVCRVGAFNGLKLMFLRLARLIHCSFHCDEGRQYNQISIEFASSFSFILGGNNNAASTGSNGLQCQRLSSSR